MLRVCMLGTVSMYGTSYGRKILQKNAIFFLGVLKIQVKFFKLFNAKPWENMTLHWKNSLCHESSKWLILMSSTSMLLLTVHTNPSTLFVTGCPINDLNMAIKVSLLMTDPFKTMSLYQANLCKGYGTLSKPQVLFSGTYETTQKGTVFISPLEKCGW
jgi:hypothetical protein